MWQVVFIALNLLSFVIIIIIIIIIIVSFVWGRRQSELLFYRLGQSILRQIDANDNRIKEDAGVEMLTDVTPVGRAAGQLYTGQNVSCTLY